METTTLNKAIIKEAFFSEGISNEQYLSSIENKARLFEQGKYSSDDAEHDQYLKLNVTRTKRIEKTYNPSPDMLAAVSSVKNTQYWLVISEDWCGDSAQNVPMLAKIAGLNSNIQFRIIYRDENPKIMDLYLTNGTRSIPKLIAFDEDWNELFTWGARPEEGQKVVDEGKAAGLTKQKFLEQLHIWYARNRGAALEQEMIQLLSN